MNVSYNYSNLKNREKRLYSVSGTKISTSGITTSFLKVLSISMVAFNIFGVAICLFMNKMLYWPFDANYAFDPTFAIIFLGIPIGVTCCLQFIKIQHYKLVDFLVAYFKPKKAINEQGQILKFVDYKNEGFIERLF